jgi:hypothetical protein
MAQAVGEPLDGREYRSGAYSQLLAVEALLGHHSQAKKSVLDRKNTGLLELDQITMDI